MSIVLVPDVLPQLKVGAVSVLPMSVPRLRTGSGYLAGEFPSGITSIDGVPTPAEIRVLLHTSSGQYADGIVVAVTHSSPAGEWLVEGIPMEFTYDVVCRHADFNDLIWSNVVPKPM